MHFSLKPALLDLHINVFPVFFPLIFVMDAKQFQELIFLKIIVKYGGNLCHALFQKVIKPREKLFFGEGKVLK